jgi:hypothetical protein
MQVISITVKNSESCRLNNGGQKWRSLLLVLLAALSLFCTTGAWAVDHAVFGSVFAALGIVAVLGAAAPRRYLTLKRANASRSSGQWRHDDYDVGAVVGRIMRTPAAPEARHGGGRLPTAIIAIAPPRLARSRRARRR